MFPKGWRRDREKRDDNDEVSSVRSEGSSVRGFYRGRGRSRGRGRGHGRGNPRSMNVENNKNGIELNHIRQ